MLRGACSPPHPAGMVAAAHAQIARRKNLEIVTIAEGFFVNFGRYLQPGRIAC
jgi:hypothetical protein